MGIHTTEAIVLRRYLYRETSVIVSCLTEHFGKLRGLVKGLRQYPNRHRSAMEPMTVNKIVFYDTHNSQIHLISQCELMAPLADLQKELEITKIAAFCVELVDTVVPIEEPQPAVYQLLKNTLNRLTTQPQDALDALRSHFILRLLRLSGFHPQLDECTGCNATVHSGAHWSARQGGLLCNRCLHHDPKAEPMAVSLLGLLEELSQQEQPQSFSTQAIPGLRRRLEDFLKWRLDKPLKTLTT